ncbi:MAG: hypothetical protein WCA04_08795 [Geobacteraceae bacterium]
MKKLILEISNDAYYFRTAEYVILDLNEEEIGAIKELSEGIKRSGDPEATFSHSCSAANADYAAGYHNGKVTLKKYEKWMDAVHLHIGRDTFYVTGFYGYSNVGWRTGSVPISALDEEGDYDMR